MSGTRHSRRLRYIASVLWLMGYSVKEITDLANARGLGESRLTVNTVNGILNRSKYGRRSEMTLPARQGHLDDLRQKREDDRFFDDAPWLADDLNAAQRRLQSPLAAGRDGRTQNLVMVGDGRMGSHRPSLDLNSDPLVWLDNRNMLRDPLSTPLSANQRRVTQFAGMYRPQAGRRLQGLFERSQVTRLAGVDYAMFIDRGNGSSDIPDQTIDAMRQLIRMKRGIPAEPWLILERLLLAGQWLWRGESDHRRREIYGEVRQALDCVAVFLAMLRVVDFRIRWPELHLDIGALAVDDGKNAKQYPARRSELPPRQPLSAKAG